MKLKCGKGGLSQVDYPFLWHYDFRMKRDPPPLYEMGKGVLLHSEIIATDQFVKEIGY